MGKPEHAHHSPSQAGNSGFDHAAAVARLEHEAQLTAEVDATAIGACANLLKGTQVQSVTDLGAGPGLATVELANAFPHATVVAIDKSEAMLRSVAQRAERAGLTARIATRQLDLNQELSALGQQDLVWSSMTVHHTKDPERLIDAIATVLRPGGVACVLEHADPPTVRLASELGRPGLWDRLAHTRSLTPHGGHQSVAELSDMVVNANLTIQEDRGLTATHADPTRLEVRKYAFSQLSAVATHMGDRIDADDLRALQTFVDTASPYNAPDWQGLEVNISRRLLTAQRPRSSS